MSYIKLEVDCPFQWGDRVDHPVFGFGTVCGEPTIVNCGDLELMAEVEWGWKFPVEWDDPDRGVSSMSYGAYVRTPQHLRKVSSPTAKGSAFWENEWQKLVREVQDRRKAIDELLQRGFRQTTDLPDAFERLKRLEGEAVASLLAFVVDDEAGLHE